MEKAIAKSKKRKFKNLPLFMIALPGIVYLLINNYIPMFGIFPAFKNYSLRKGVFGSDWCGLQNFQFLFKTKDAWIMTRNTILYNVAFIIIGTIVAIAIAVMMCELGKKHALNFSGQHCFCRTRYPGRYWIYSLCIFKCGYRIYQ